MKETKSNSSLVRLLESSYFLNRSKYFRRTRPFKLASYKKEDIVFIGAENNDRFWNLENLRDQKDQHHRYKNKLLMFTNEFAYRVFKTFEKLKFEDYQIRRQWVIETWKGIKKDEETFKDFIQWYANNLTNTGSPDEIIFWGIIKDLCIPVKQEKDIAVSHDTNYHFFNLQWRPRKKIYTGIEILTPDGLKRIQSKISDCRYTNNFEELLEESKKLKSFFVCRDSTMFANDDECRFWNHFRESKEQRPSDFSFYFEGYCDWNLIESLQHCVLVYKNFCFFPIKPALISQYSIDYLKDLSNLNSNFEVILIEPSEVRKDGKDGILRSTMQFVRVFDSWLSDQSIASITKFYYNFSKVDWKNKKK